MQKALYQLPPTLQGPYCHLEAMSDTERDTMIKEHILYAKGDRYSSPFLTSLAVDKLEI